MLQLGEEVLAPFAKPDEQGHPLFQLPGDRRSPAPLLGYGPGAYLGRMVDIALKQAAVPVHLNRVYETDMAEGLKAMATEGHGIAFLPKGAVLKELKAKRLVHAAPSSPALFEIGFDIRIYRAKPSVPLKPGKNSSVSKRITHDLWEYLQRKSLISSSDG
jgi:DNA-binding transcriptional LysR family regulator